MQPTAVANSPRPQKRARIQVPVPADLGEYVQRDAALLAKLGWKVFCSSRRRRSDFNSLVHMKHPARQLLQHVKSNGVPVILKSAPWSQQQRDDAIHRGRPT